MSDMIWYCSKHDEPVRYEAGGAMHWCSSHVKGTPVDCLAGQRRLVSPTALIVERDENGEWPDEMVEAVAEALFQDGRVPARLKWANAIPALKEKYRHTACSALDALAEGSFA